MDALLRKAALHQDPTAKAFGLNLLVGVCVCVLTPRAEGTHGSTEKALTHCGGERQRRLLGGPACFPRCHVIKGRHFSYILP